jgi:hypothetical protein
MRRMHQVPRRQLGATPWRAAGARAALGEGRRQSMKRNGKSKKVTLNHETLRNLSTPELRDVNGGRVSGVACYASDLTALYGISTTGFICPND